MEYIILGLLLFQSRSIYELRARIEKGIHLMYSSSMGSIQAAIKKLLAGGHITCQETKENGRNKKLYSITPSGKAHFHTWLNAPPEASNMKNPDLVKIYFMGLSDKSRRAENVRIHIQNLTEALHALELIYQEFQEATVPEPMRDIYAYQLATVDYGIASMTFNIQWYQKLLDKIEREEL